MSASLASGAHPMTTFPNCYSLLPPVAAPAQAAGANWSSPQRGSPSEDLRNAVREEDWETAYSEGLTKIHMRAEWSASAERCSLLQWLVSTSGARHMLEVGSFCGAGALALAEGSPEDSEVCALELDSYVVSFGRRFRMRSPAGHKIKYTVGPAMESLQAMAADSQRGRVKAFDFAVVDADKEGMRKYFDLLWKTPGLVTQDAIVCIDMTPFKGQPPVRYLKYGFPHRWQSSSGQEEINALRSYVLGSPDFKAYEFGGMLIVQRARDD